MMLGFKSTIFHKLGIYIVKTIRVIGHVSGMIIVAPMAFLPKILKISSSWGLPASLGGGATMTYAALPLLENTIKSDDISQLIINNKLLRKKIGNQLDSVVVQDNTHQKLLEKFDSLVKFKPNSVKKCQIAANISYVSSLFLLALSTATYFIKNEKMDENNTWGNALINCSAISGLLGMLISTLMQLIDYTKKTNLSQNTQKLKTLGEELFQQNPMPISFNEYTY